MRVAEGLEWRHIYWVRGKVPAYYRHTNEATDPPCSGWQHAFVMRGDKRSTIFCPYSFNAYSVSNHSLEIVSSAEPSEAFRPDHVADLLVTNWKEMQSRGWLRDYDACARVLRRLGLSVPAQIIVGGAEDNVRHGGKEVGPRLLKPVKPGGKRGLFLKWFLENEGTRSVREAMVEFSMTRSNVLSYLYMLYKDHGIGYVLVGDAATLVLPDGCPDPFKTEKVPNDDAWLD